MMVHWQIALRVVSPCPDATKTLVADTATPRPLASNHVPMWWNMLHTYARMLVDLCHVEPCAYHVCGHSNKMSATVPLQMLPSTTVWSPNHTVELFLTIPISLRARTNVWESCAWEYQTRYIIGSIWLRRLVATWDFLRWRMSCADNMIEQQNHMAYAFVIVS